MKTLIRLSYLLFVLLLLAVPLVIHAQKKFELADMGKLTNLSDPQISPDGKSIVMVVSRPDYEANRYNVELVLVDVASGKNRPLTYDRAGVSQPRWSTTGEQLAFLARPLQGKEVQLFILNMGGGEAKQITKAPRGVQHFAWSPDGTSIAFVTADEPTNKEQIEKGYDSFEAGNNDMFVSSLRTPSHIWLINSQGGEAKRLTSGTWTLPVTIPPGAPSSPLSWSPDGKTIAFVKVATVYSGR